MFRSVLVSLGAPIRVPNAKTRFRAVIKDVQLLVQHVCLDPLAPLSRRPHPPATRPPATPTCPPAQPTPARLPTHALRPPAHTRSPARTRPPLCPHPQQVRWPHTPRVRWPYDDRDRSDTRCPRCNTVQYQQSPPTLPPRSQHISPPVKNESLTGHTPLRPLPRCCRSHVRVLS